MSTLIYLYSSPVNPRLSTLICPLLITREPTTEHTHIPYTQHPLTHDWAHSYILYALPVNPRLSTLLYPLLITREPTTEHTYIPSTHPPLSHEWAHSYTLYSSPVGHLMEISSYSCNSSPQIWLVLWRLDQGNYMDLIPYLYNKQKHCIILFCFLRRTDQPWDLSNALSEYN